MIKALILCGLLSACSPADNSERHPIDKLVVHCAMETMTITHPSDWATHTQYGCSKKGYFTFSR
jgi:hypothetical protein